MEKSNSMSEGKLMFPKSEKKKRMKHPESILNTEKGICLLCLLEGDTRHKVTEEHHVLFGRGMRKISEENGLKCNLCIEHHRTGKTAVHRNEETRIFLTQLFQRKYENLHSHEEWMQMAGKNWL